MDYFESKDGSRIVFAMIRAIQKNKDFLSEIDGLIGDGDHGVNMNKGFTLCERRMAGKQLGLSEALELLGNVLMTEIGGSMGPIYGTIFLTMSEVSRGAERIDAVLFSNMLNEALTELQVTVPGEVGDKTLVDTLAPAREAFAGVLKNSENFSNALNAMTAAARCGMESTKDMAARFGRSSRLGERSRGVLDAGAVSCELLLRAMADEIQLLLAE